MIRVRPVIFIIISILVAIFFWSILSGTVLNSRAGETRVGFTFVPSSVTMPVGENTVVDLIIAPEQSGNRLSGVDISLQSENAEIVTVGEPVALGELSDAVLTPVLRSISPGKAHVSFVVTEGTTLPQAIKVPVLVNMNAAGTGKIHLQRELLQATGPGDSVEYGIGTVNDITVTAQ